jgi:O-antigen/teichoic acid export membrane protein
MSIREAVRGQRRLGRLTGNPVARNLGARVGALAGLTLASFLVAREAGPAGIGAWSLLRVLPWLTGVLLGCGLYGAAPYILSGPTKDKPGYRSTFPVMAIVAGIVGAGCWVAAAPALAHRLFPETSPAVVALAGVTVLSQLLETTAKSCSQGTYDLHGANRMIVLEELLFVPWFAALVLLGVDPYLSIVLALLAGDLTNSTQGWIRLARRGFLAGSRPSWACAAHIARFGLRAEVGSISLLLNARADFVVVAVLVSPAALGIYAVATRYAELLRLPGLAMSYVMYPALARGTGTSAAERARGELRRMGWLPAVAAVPMALAAPLLLPLVYGPEFRAAVVPAWILIVGLSTGGLNGISAAYLMADGRPGTASVAMGCGLVANLALDLLLVPAHQVVGAALASCLAYLITTVLLVVHLQPLHRRRDVQQSLHSTTI